MSNLIYPARSAGGAEGYQVENSIVVDSTKNFVRTMGLATNSLDWCVSMWIKRSAINGTIQQLVRGYYSSTIYSLVTIYNDEALYAVDVSHNNVYNWMYSVKKQRDPAKWIHVLYHHDSVNQFVGFYVDGVLDVQGGVLGGGAETRYDMCLINQGTFLNYLLYSCDMYAAEVVLLDGLVLPPESFGEWHPDNDKVWRPIDVSGLDYSGANSCHLDFKDATSATTLGYDVSGNDNHWTPTNIAVEDQSTDTPSNNCCTLNSIEKPETRSLTNGNRTGASTSGWYVARGTTQLPETGKWYFEFELTGSGAADCGIGVQTIDDTVSTWIGAAGAGYGYNNTGIYIDGALTTVDDTTFVVGDILQCFVDMDTGDLWFGFNNYWVNGGDPVAGTGANVTGITSEHFFCTNGNGTTAIGTARFNPDEFSYTPPTGGKALTSKNLPYVAIKNSQEYFDINLYTGNATARTIETTNKADHVVIKNRDQADEWKVLDSVRGATKELSWDSTNIESTDANGLTSFGVETGFDLGTGAAGYNDSGEGFVSYNWTKGAIPGFDIVEYAGDGLAGHNIPHTLGVVPEMFMVKAVDRVASWYVYNKTVGATSSLVLDSPAAAISNIAWFNNTEPTSVQFTLGTAVSLNSSISNYVAYLWSSVPGFSKVFSYTGNGLADGPFVHMGFKPRFVMVKAVTQALSWWVTDWERGSSGGTGAERANPVGDSLVADGTGAEGSYSTSQDYLSNGWKLRWTSTSNNQSGVEYIGIAFAEYPFKLTGGGA